MHPATVYAAVSCVLTQAADSGVYPPTSDMLSSSYESCSGMDEEGGGRRTTR